MGINGAIMGRSTPNQAVINTVGVANLEEAIAAVRNAGGTVGHDIDTIANVGRFTYATDTRGQPFRPARTGGDVDPAAERRLPDARRVIPARRGLSARSSLLRIGPGRRDCPGQC